MVAAIFGPRFPFVYFVVKGLLMEDYRYVSTVVFVDKFSVSHNYHIFIIIYLGPVSQSTYLTDKVVDE